MFKIADLLRDNRNYKFVEEEEREERRELEQEELAEARELEDLTSIDEE